MKTKQQQNVQRDYMMGVESSSNSNQRQSDGCVSLINSLLTLCVMDDNIVGLFIRDENIQRASDTWTAVWS